MMGPNTFNAGKSPRGLHAFLFFLATAVFWSLRVYYWSITNERPFSDMANYDAVAHRILGHWDYSLDSFWRSYYTPTLSLLRAVQLFFGGESLRAWQFFQTSILFVSLCWLIYEISRKTRSPWIWIALLWLVSLSKSSIFWSLKLARESVAEAFIYLCIAVALSSFRKEKASLYFLAGIVFVAAILNRPNFVIILPLFLGGYIFLYYSNYRRERNSVTLKKSIRLLCAFLLGVCITWLPWALRSYNLYGHVVLLSTQGPISFFWELGEVKVPVAEGRELSLNACNCDAPQKYANDYAFYNDGKLLMRKWLEKNWRLYLKLVASRAWRNISDRTIYLTKVSRAVLFPGLLNMSLIDKSSFLIISGIIGLVACVVISPADFFVIPAVTVAPWLFSMFFIGYPRMIEPMIPFFLFGNTTWIVMAKRFYSRRNERPNSGAGDERKWAGSQAERDMF